MNAPEKIYVHKSQYWGLMANEHNTTNDDIEYTRTDAFIEKATKYLQEHLIDYWSQGVTDESKFIERFKNYMKGE